MMRGNSLCDAVATGRKALEMIQNGMGVWKAVLNNVLCTLKES